MKSSGPDLQRYFAALLDERRETTAQFGHGGRRNILKLIQRDSCGERLDQAFSDLNNCRRSCVEGRDRLLPSFVTRRVVDFPRFNQCRNDHSRYSGAFVVLDHHSPAFFSRQREKSHPTKGTCGMGDRAGAVFFIVNQHRVSKTRQADRYVVHCPAACAHIPLSL